MLAWQKHVMLEAEQAANMCIACGRYGHYPVDCPEEVSLPVLSSVEKRRNRLHLIAYACWFLAGMIVGLWIREGRF